MDSTYSLNNCRITCNKQGSPVYTKMSFPVHCGLFTELETEEFVFHFNLNGEIIRARLKSRDWVHPHEWLKRTDGNDWVYYSTGGYTGVFEATGEYYLPNLQYPTNNLLGGRPFARKEVNDLVSHWHEMLVKTYKNLNNRPGEIDRFFQQAISNSPEMLAEKASRLFSIIGNRISVLPPDARHVDYNLIPLMISRGCLYKCRFCKVKNNTPFAEQTEKNIETQLMQLRNFYGRNIKNYNALFLGEHDGLQTRPPLLRQSIQKAYETFHFADSYLKETSVFLFGSVTSLQNCSESDFRELDMLPGMKYINIGLESCDQETLDRIGKPLQEKEVKEAFKLICHINEHFSGLEISANFIFDENLPENHYISMLELIRDSQKHVKPKGAIYLSPLKFDSPARKHLFAFNRLKTLSRLPTYLYIIQRL